MPYPHEHAFRVKEPSQFDSFARKNNEFGDGIHVIYGIKDNKSQVQSIRFSASKWTFSEAKKWMSDHNWKYISAEEATGKNGCMVECKACHYKFDLTSEPEVAMGATKCPNCDSVIDQEGNVLKEGSKNIVSRLFYRPFKNQRDGGFYNG